MKKTKKHYYNMIEVVLAMGIVAIGMTSIMGLFPVGINASRDAVGYNTSVEMGSNLIAYIRSYASRNSNNFDTLFTGGSSLSTGLMDNLTLAGINTNSQNFASELKLNSGSVVLNSSTNFAKRATGVYQIIESPATIAGLKVYYLRKGSVDASGDPNSDKFDFAAMAIVWKTQVTSPVPGTTTSNTDVGYANMAGLNVEISWPVALNYNEREKQYFYIELKRPEFNLQD